VQARGERQGGAGPLGKELAQFSIEYVHQLQEEHQSRFAESLAAAQRTVQSKDEEIKRLSEHLATTKAHYVLKSQVQHEKELAQSRVVTWMEEHKAKAKREGESLAESHAREVDVLHLRLEEMEERSRIERAGHLQQMKRSSWETRQAIERGENKTREVERSCEMEMQGALQMHTIELAAQSEALQRAHGALPSLL